MARHIKETVYPDCPECGREMRMYGRYIEGTQTMSTTFSYVKTNAKVNVYIQY